MVRKRPKLGAPPVTKSRVAFNQTVTANITAKLKTISPSVGTFGVGRKELQVRGWRETSCARLKATQREEGSAPRAIKYRIWSRDTINRHYAAKN